VRRAPEDAADARIVAALAGLATGLGLRVVAEGVETDEQLDFVRHCGCDEAQGYTLSRPLPAAQFIEYARQRA
jgi:EAL domain-containing protein (putative c-di-GMP-specific phosphodiesterase class I)